MVKQYNYNSNINMVEVPVKVYKFCWKCGKSLPEGSIEPWCDFECKREYMTEIRQDLDDIVSDLR